MLEHGDLVGWWWRVESSGPVWEACRLQTRIAATRERVSGRVLGPTGRFLCLFSPPRRAASASMSPTTRPRSPRAGPPPFWPDRSQPASVGQHTAWLATITGAVVIGWRLEGVRQHARGGSVEGRERCHGPAHAVCGSRLFWAGG